jgi:hypothetical protein
MTLRIPHILLSSVAVLTFSAFPAYAQGGTMNGKETQSRAGETTQSRTGGGEQKQQRGSKNNAPSEQEVIQPYKVGDFIVNPTIGLVEYYDDNIFYTRNNTQDDFITVINPALFVSSDWSQHALNLSTGASIGRYRDNDNEDYEDYFAGFDGHIDIAPKSRIFGGAEYNKRHEGRESPDDVLGIKPTEYDLRDFFIGGQHEFNQVGVKIGATLQDYDFDDVMATGGMINNDDRDRREYELGTRVSRLWKDNIRVFVQGVLGKREYDDAQDDLGFNRDSDGYGLAAGAIFNPMRNVRAEILAGGLWQHYDDPNLPNIRDPDIGAIVTWKPSAYTNVDFILDRRIAETTLANASGYVSTSADINMTHYLTQELNFNAGFGFTTNNYEGVEREDDLINLSAGSRYYFTPQIYSGVDYEFLHRDSDQAGQDFFDNRVMVRAGAHLKPSYALAGLPSGFGNDGSFFIGAQTGHGSTFTALNGPRGMAGTVTADFGDHGSVAGLFGGYDHSFGSWFMGAEAGLETSNNFDWNHIESGGRIFSVEREESFGVALRTGYRQPNNVAYYGRAGLLWTGFDTNYTNAGNSVSNGETQFGFQIGGGIEAPVIGNSTFIRMDYTNETYEDYNINLPSGSDNFDNSSNIMRVGLAYRLGMNPAKEYLLAPDFSGSYVGAQAGYGGFATRNRGPRNAGADLRVDRASHGGTGGLFAGYGFLPFDNIYLGAEAEAEMSYADWNIDRDPTGRIYDAQKDWTLGGALRAGYVFNDTVMVYGRAGGVMSGVDTDYTRGAQDISQEDTLSGIRYGGGMEVAATERLFLRMDYTYTDYEDYDVNYGTGVDTFEPTETMVRLGVGLRF